MEPVKTSLTGRRRVLGGSLGDAATYGRSRRRPSDNDLDGGLHSGHAHGRSSGRDSPIRVAGVPVRGRGVSLRPPRHEANHAAEERGDRRGAHNLSGAEESGPGAQSRKLGGTSYAPTPAYVSDMLKFLRGYRDAGCTRRGGRIASSASRGPSRRVRAGRARGRLRRCPRRPRHLRLRKPPGVQRRCWRLT